MPSIVKDIHVTAPATEVWDAVSDFHAVHKRVVPGFLVDSVQDGDDRVITFESGAVAKERFVSRDDQRRRFVYAIAESALGFTHYQGTVEVVEEPGAEGCRIVWTADFLPDDPGPIVDALMTAGSAAMVQNFGAGAG